MNRRRVMRRRLFDMQRIKSVIQSIKKTIRRMCRGFDASDVPALGIVVALTCILHGGNRIHDGAGWLALGVILLLYIRPLKGWWNP